LSPVLTVKRPPFRAALERALVLALASCLATPLASTASPKSLVIDNPKDRGPDHARSRWLDGAERDLSGLRLSHFDLWVKRSGVRIDHGASGIVIKDGVFRLVTPTTSPNLPAAIEIINGFDVLIEDVEARDFRMIPVEGRYNNGDCFSGERQSGNITLRRTKAISCSDGGYDFKTDGLVLDDVSAEDVNFCLRIWGRASASTIVCKDWNKGAIQLMPGASLAIDTLVLKPAQNRSQTVFIVAKGASLSVGRCQGAPLRTSLVTYRDGGDASNTVVRLGPGCGAP
jgi:hypothetical protein